MLSASPFVYSVLNDIGQSQRVGHSINQAQAIATNPMMASIAVADDLAATTIDYYKVHLTNGEILTASDGVISSNRQQLASTLTLEDSTGQTLASAQTNKHSFSPHLAYRIQNDGDYFVTISSPQATGTTRYSLNIRPIGLSSTLPGIMYLDTNHAELDVFLNTSHPSSPTLEFTGLAGHGFGIRGNWVQTVIPTEKNSASTYTATGATYLETAAGEIPLPPAPGGLTVSTRASVFGAYVGELNNFSVNLAFPLNEFAGNFGARSSFGLALLNVTEPRVQLGIGLGKDLTTVNAPMLGDVPYLYFSVPTSGSLSFGGVTASLTPAPNLAVVADPGDPCLFVGVSGLPGPVPSFQFGGSANGLIPFKPLTVPQHFHGNIYGQVLWGASVDFNFAKIPVSIDGESVYNLDARHTGKLLNGVYRNASAMFTDLGKRAHQAALLSALRDVSWGTNDQINLSLTAEGFPVKLQMPLGQGTAIYDGPNETFNVRGNAVNPLGGTSLSGIFQPQAFADGYVNLRNGEFDIKMRDGVLVDRYGGVASIEATNKTITVSADVRFITGDVQFNGQLSTDGSYVLTGQAGVNVYLATVNAWFFLIGDSQGNTSLYIQGGLQALGTGAYMFCKVQSNGDFSLTGHASTNFYIADGSADFTFSDQQGVFRMYVVGHLKVLDAVAVDVSGSVGSDGSFTLNGHANVNFYIGSAATSFSLSENSGRFGLLSASAQLAVLDAIFSMSGDIDQSGGYRIYGGIASGLLGLGNAYGDYTFASNNPNGGWLDTSFTALGQQFFIAGSVDSTGYFDLTTSVTVSIAGSTVIAGFDFYGYGGSGAFRLNGSFTVGVNFYLGSASLSATIYVLADGNGNVQYSGSGTASVSVVGWSGNVSVGVSNNELSFYVSFIHKTITVPLP
jgi:hypothetical protein